MEYVDLGLPSKTLWATCNLGSSSPEQYGDYFAWGDVQTKDSYIGQTCSTYDLDIVHLKLEDYIDCNNVLALIHDAASRILGDECRIPTGEEAQELVNNCAWVWVNNYNNSNIPGMLGTSKINRNSIFFPAAGYRNNDQLIMVGKCGGYWTSSPNFSASNRAWSIAFDGSLINVFNHGIRYKGYTIRPVIKT